MTVDYAHAAEQIVAAYNAKNFDRFRSLVSPKLDFAHFNRNFAFDNRDALLDVLQQFASSMVPDRRFLPPERVSVCGGVVVREAFYSGTAAVDLPGFAAAGGRIMLKFCSVMRFDPEGLLVEWKDYG